MTKLENTSVTVPSKYRYVIVEYYPESSEQPLNIGVIVQGKDELLFRFISPDEAGDLVPDLSREIVFGLEATFIRDKEKGAIPIRTGEGNERKAITVTSPQYLDYLRSTFLNTITFTEPQTVVATRRDSLLDSLFSKHVLEPMLTKVSAQTSKVENLTDGLIVLLYAGNNEPIEGSLRLQKLTYLLKEETSLGKNLKEDLAYVPHHYGPYSPDLTSMLEVLQQEGLIEIEVKPQIEAQAEADRRLIQKKEQDINPADKKKTMRVYKLTSEGARWARQLIGSMQQTDLEEIVKLKKRFSTAPTQELIDYVYSRYGHMTTKSKLKNRSRGRHTF